MYNEMETLTKQLVSISSVNSEPEGEAKIAEFIYGYFKNLPYFQEHPEYLCTIPLKNDPLQRKNVFALLRGTAGDYKDTILFHGHIDTVGVEDFGHFKEYAFDCDKLLDAMLASNDIPEVLRKDIETGDYLVGRGSCDMKSGDAVFMVLIKYLSQNPDKLKGNILVSFNPVEENQHTGIIEGLDHLLALQKKYGLQYKFAINNDYTCPLYEGDPHQYIYTGTVGKLLPCFYIYGKETHVGQCFEGFDAANTAAELVRLINLNHESCDGYHEEYTLPPSVLYMKDLKDFYNVQTAQSAYVYFNYFVHNKSMDTIMAELKAYARTALEHMMTRINSQYKEFCRINHQEYQPYRYPCAVLSYDELYQRVKETYKGDLDGFLSEKTARELSEGVDKREIPLHLVETLLPLAQITTPTIVLFFSAPYCPHNTLKAEIPEEKELYDRIADIVHNFSEEEQLPYKILQFFPSLSDSSYLKIDDDAASVDLLIRNFPDMNALYPLPVDKIQELNIPALNYGCYGKDAHKWTERLYKPYTFGVLPKLILKTIDNFL